MLFAPLEARREEILGWSFDLLAEVEKRITTYRRNTQEPSGNMYRKVIHDSFAFVSAFGPRSTVRDSIFTASWHVLYPDAQRMFLVFLGHKLADDMLTLSTANQIVLLMQGAGLFRVTVPPDDQDSEDTPFGNDLAMYIKGYLEHLLREQKK